MVVGLIRDNNEQAYTEEVRQLMDWCNTNNLILNADQTKEIIVDLKRNPLLINNTAVEVTSSTKFLGVCLSWSLNTAVTDHRDFIAFHLGHCTQALSIQSL